MQYAEQFFDGFVNEMKRANAMLKLSGILTSRFI